MFTEIVVIVVALAAVGWLLSRLGRGATSVEPEARPAAAVPPTPRTPSAPSAPAVPPASGAAVPAATRPEGHSLDPWRVGDAAFVDGYIVGRYVERARAEDERAATSDERLGTGDDLGSGDDLADGYGHLPFGHAADAGDLDPDGFEPDEPEAEDGADEFGDDLGDGFGDGFDDDW